MTEAEAQIRRRTERGAATSTAVTARRFGARGATRGDVTSRRQRTARGSVPQPRAELAGFQRPGARARRRHVAAAPGTGEVPGDLRVEPRRVLHGACRGPEAPRRDGPVRALGRRLVAARTAAPDQRAHPADRQQARPRVPRLGAARAGRRGHRDRHVGRARRRRALAAVDLLPRAGVPGADPAGGRPGAPVPVRQRAEPEPGDHRQASRRRRAALRPNQGARQRGPLRRARAAAKAPPTWCGSCRWRS